MWETLFFDSFFSTFIFTFQGETALTAMIAFDYDKSNLYLYSVLGSCLGLFANYMIGRTIAWQLLPLLGGEAKDKFIKTQTFLDTKLLLLLPITSLGFISNVMALEGNIGGFLNVFGTTIVLIFSGALTLFCGLFTVDIIKFVTVILLFRLISYYLYIF